MPAVLPLHDQRIKAFRSAISPSARSAEGTERGTGLPQLSGAAALGAEYAVKQWPSRTEASPKLADLFDLNPLAVCHRTGLLTVRLTPDL
jgi:hypothetical protein